MVMLSHNLKAKVIVMSTITSKSLQSAPAVAPESVTPESVTPEIVTPEIVTPESVTPESVTPESVTPESVTKCVTATVNARQKQWLRLLNEFAPVAYKKSGDGVLAAKLVHEAVADGRADDYVFGGKLPLDDKAIKKGRADFSRLHKEHCVLRFVWQSLGLHAQVAQNLGQL